MINTLLSRVPDFALIKWFSPMILISPRLMHLVENLSHIVTRSMSSDAILNDNRVLFLSTENLASIAQNPVRDLRYSH